MGRPAGPGQAGGRLAAIRGRGPVQDEGSRGWFPWERLLMDEAEVIRRALEQAKAKRSPDAGRLRPRDRDWSKVIPPPGKPEDYCPTCDYPLQGLPPAFCRKCAEDRLWEKERAARYSVMMGGRKAWDTYLESAFVRTSYNAHALQRAKEFDWRTQSILFH